MTTQPHTVPERAAYSIAETMQLLGGCSRGHIYNLIKRGELRVVHLGRRVLIPASEIKRLVDAK